MQHITTVYTNQTSSCIYQCWPSAADLPIACHPPCPGFPIPPLEEQHRIVAKVVN